jgi:hypothetical protein
MDANPPQPRLPRCSLWNFDDSKLLPSSSESNDSADHFSPVDDRILCLTCMAVGAVAGSAVVLIDWIVRGN